MSLVAFADRNHPQQPVDDDVDDRRTPADFFDALHREHHFTLDAAASEENAKLPRFFDRHSDGLSQPWAEHVVWCNPPYSACGAWVAKALAEVRNKCPKVVMLLPANRCEQPWWQEMIEPVRDGRGAKSGPRVTTRFVATRLRFGAKQTSDDAKKKGENRPPFGVVLVTFEARP